MARYLYQSVLVIFMLLVTLNGVPMNAWLTDDRTWIQPLFYKAGTVRAEKINKWSLRQKQKYAPRTKTATTVRRGTA